MDVDTEAKIARIDERTQHIQKMLEKLVTKDEFAPVKRIVYGSVTLVITGVILGLLALVVT